jgi:hypothetical protein
MANKPEEKVPWVKTEKTQPKTNSSDIYNADLHHERTLEYFVHSIELSALDKDQHGVISLVDAGQSLGIQLPAAELFFESLRQLSSGEEGKGITVVKEVITAGAFPLSLLFPQPGGLLDSIKGLFGKGQQPKQG